MARKTNKTAHVLNLITNSPKENEDEDEIIDESAVSKDNEIFEITPKPVMVEKLEPSNDTSIKSELSKPSNTPIAPILEILYNEHDPLSDLIKNVLEEDEAINNDAQIKANSINSAAVIEEPKKVEDAKIFDFSLEFDDDGNEIEHIEPEVAEETKEIVKTEVKVDLTPPLEPEVGEITLDDGNCDCSSSQLLEQLEIAQNQHFHDRKNLNSMVDLDFKYVNVYEIIVQDKLLDYMKKFDVCMCDRCIVDTFALAVTSLPTKIVVVDKSEIFPLVNFFEVKNTAMISTALIKACMTVKDKPNHNN